MRRFLKIAVALILLIQSPVSRGLAEGDVLIPESTCPAAPEPAFGDSSDADACSLSETADVDDADALPGELPPAADIVEFVDPTVPEAECELGEETPDGITYEAAAVDAAAAAYWDAVAAPLSDAGDAEFASPEDEQATISVTPPTQKNEADEAAPEPNPNPVPQALRLGVGEKYSLSCDTATGAWHYKSLNKRIATVSADGVVRARKRGRTGIVASNGEAVFEYTVKVYKTPKYLRFPAKSMYLTFDPVANTGNQAQLAPKLSPKSRSSIYYYGYNPEIVSVSGDGAVTAVGVGTTKIRAKTYNRKKAEIKITVVSTASDPAPAAQTRQTRVIAHRGSAHWEENTLTAFQNFASTGADAVELDARSCLDGTQVVFHDAAFSANGARYRVSELTLDQLRALKPSICTLDEALETIAPTGKDIFLELKETADGSTCAASVQAHGLEARTVFFSFYKAPLAQVYSALPSATLGLSLKKTAKPYSKALIKQAKALHLSFFMANKRLMNKKVVRFWHGKGFGIYVWTVNDPRTMRALNAMGVDGILTDYPEACVQAAAAG